VVGGVAAKATDAQLDALERFGAAIGLAYQIVDDVLDVTGTSEVLGKTAGRDIQLGKTTYPSLMGIDAAENRARELVTDGMNALAMAGIRTPEFETLGALILARAS
jgi:geranylgeranyl pyrophosphate synthase